MIDNWIRNRLDKQGLMVVPKTWAGDYTEVVAKKEMLHKVIREIGREYNGLLRDFAELAPEKKLKTDLKEADVETKGIKGEDLIDLFVETFKIDFNDDKEEKVQ